MCRYNFVSKALNVVATNVLIASAYGLIRSMAQIEVVINSGGHTLAMEISTSGR